MDSGGRKTWIAVLGLTGIGALLRFGTLDRQSFWLDELVTVSLLRGDFGSMLHAIPEGEATPYLYYVLAWPWARVFGFGEIGLRSLSALAGTAIVPVAYGAGAALVSRRVGLVAAALVSVSPFLVWYAQEARSYSLFALLTACTVLFFGRALRAPRGSAYLGWAVSSGLAIATHYFAVFLVVPEAVWLLTRSRSRRLAMLSSVLPLAILLLHIPLVLDQRGAGEAATDAPLASRIAGVPKGLAVGYNFPAEVAGSIVAGALLLAGFVLLAAGRSAEQRRAALVPGSLAAFSIVAPVVLALTGADYVIVRNTILAIVPAAICIAAGFAANRLGLAAGAALCVLLLTITVSVSLDRRYGRTDWRGVADRLEAPTRERAIVVTPFMSRSLWSTYLVALEEPQGETASVGEIAVVGLATEGGFSGGPVRAPNVAPPAAPDDFRLIVAERKPTYTLFVFRAPGARQVATTELAQLRLTDIQPGVLLQRFRGEPPPTAR